MYIAGRPAKRNIPPRLSKMVQKKSQSVSVVPLSSHADVPLLFVGNKPASVIHSKKATHVKVPSFSGDVSVELIQQYGRGSSRESGDHANTFPQIKGARGPGDRLHQSREKCTSLSLERVELQGKTIFTEGLSSISRRNEPLLVFHRKDIHGANMPETVKVARERSKVVFGVRNYEIHRNIQNKARSVAPLQTDTGLTVDKMTADDLSFRNTSTTNSESNLPPRESPISKAIKRMEQKYGVSPSVSPYPLALAMAPICEDNYMQNQNTPKHTPRRTQKETVKKGSVKVVSLSPDFRGKERRSPRLHVSLTDERYNQREAFRQHRHENRLNPMKIPPDIDITEERLALKVSMHEDKKAKQNKLLKRYIYQSTLSRAPGAKGYTGDGTSTTDLDVLSTKKTDGSFHVRGVVGTSVARGAIWIPGSVSEDDTFIMNPPPTAETTYQADLGSNTREPTLMSPVDEDAKEESPSLGVLPHKSGDSSPRKKGTPTSEGRRVETRESIHSGKSSNFLLVPTTDTKTESRPSVGSSTSDDEGGIKETGVGTSRTISTQTSAHRDAGSEVKASVQTLELSLPNYSDLPSINVSGEGSSPDPVKNVKKFEPVFDAPDLDYVRDYATGRKSQQLVHNKAIRFTSPFEVEENAKRQ
ncbi:uncharacterized protein LOC121372243 [Gigantopelta aegis]|uniref:uncharacterized protein LOC121372243 n=1 Tax=Gigantopelta aegis TaxID=1735272 RepID=UPI001B887A6C|nr:uncharacterized protein LOC121372243 [Gigantopelta aegis]